MMMMKDEKEMKEEVEMETYIIFVADAADIVRGAKMFMWSNFAPHEIFQRSCGTKLLHMTIIHAPHDKTTCHVE